MQRKIKTKWMKRKIEVIREWKQNGEREKSV